MNLTHARFVDLGIESDTELMRNDINMLQKRVNELTKLRKDLSKVGAEEMENYVIESGLSKVYDNAASAALTMNRNEYRQFIQSGGLKNIIGGLQNESGKQNAEVEWSGDSPAPSLDEQPDNGSSDSVGA